MVPPLKKLLTICSRNNMTLERSESWFKTMHRAVDNPDETKKIIAGKNRKVKKITPPPAGIPNVPLSGMSGRTDFMKEVETNQEFMAEKFSGQLGPDATQDEKRS